MKWKKKKIYPKRNVKGEFIKSKNGIKENLSGIFVHYNKNKLH